MNHKHENLIATSKAISAVMHSTIMDNSTLLDKRFLVDFRKLQNRLDYGLTFLKKTPHKSMAILKRVAIDMIHTVGYHRAQLLYSSQDAETIGQVKHIYTILRIKTNMLKSHIEYTAETQTEVLS